MKLDHFVNLTNISSLKELEKVEIIAYYFSEFKDEPEIDLVNISAILVSLGYARPNISRLKNKVIKSKTFIKGSGDTFRLSVKKKQELKQLYPVSSTEEIESDDSILPEVIFEATGRQYLIKLSKQINASYERNLFDAASLLMRRLLEILLIQTFQKKVLIRKF